MTPSAVVTVMVVPSRTTTASRRRVRKRGASPLEGWKDIIRPACSTRTHWRRHFFLFRPVRTRRYPCLTTTSSSKTADRVSCCRVVACAEMSEIRSSNKSSCGESGPPPWSSFPWLALRAESIASLRFFFFFFPHLPFFPPLSFVLSFPIPAVGGGEDPGGRGSTIST